MKNLVFKTAILAAITMFFAACEPDDYAFNLPPQGSDTTIINNYYVLDTSGGVVNNYNINEYHVNLEGDCNLVGIYIDKDSTDFFTDNLDEELGQITICHEEASGNVPVISIDQYIDENGCTVFEIFVDDVLQESKTICPDTVTTILPGDTIFIHDTIIVRDTIFVRDTVFIQGHSYIREYYYEDFNNGNSYYYEDLGWNLGDGFSANQIGSSSGNGTLVEWEDFYYDTAWSPQIFAEPMAIDSISLYIGALEDYYAEILLKDVHGNIFVISSASSFASNFDWQNITTYNHLGYSVVLQNLEYFDIVKVGVSKNGDYNAKTRNTKFNADNLFVRGIKVLD